MITEPKTIQTITTAVQSKLGPANEAYQYFDSGLREDVFGFKYTPGRHEDFRPRSSEDEYKERGIQLWLDRRLSIDDLHVTFVHFYNDGAVEIGVTQRV